MNFFPEDLKEFKELLNPSNLACFNSTDILKQFLLARKQNSIFLNQNLISLINKDLDNTDEGCSLFILRFYFAQIMTSDVISLDLRKQNFIFEEGDWKPLGSKTNYRFNSDFRLALMSIYQKFFHHSEDSILSDLKKLGLVKDKWRRENKEEFEKLFFKHFYSRDVEHMKFDFKEMLSSFSKIFLYLKSQQSMIPTPFAFLGLYLSTLYYTLGQYGHPVNLKKEYLLVESACSKLSI